MGGPSELPEGGALVGGGGRAPRPDEAERRSRWYWCTLGGYQRDRGNDPPKKSVAPPAAPPRGATQLRGATPWVPVHLKRPQACFSAKRFNCEKSPYSRLFLKIEFDSVQDYLRDLEEISRALSCLDVPSLTYLAAAVSDFFVPDDQVAEHKIQSRD